MKARSAVLGGLVGLGLLAGLALWASDKSPAPAPAIQAQPAALAAPAALPSLAAASSAGLQGERSVDQLHTALFVKGSLRGTDLAGDWGTWILGNLQASFSLRMRFDHLLSTLGEANEQELRRLVRALALADLGEEKSQQVMSVWDRYIALLKKPMAQPLDMNRPETWVASLEAQRLMRRNALGADWAEAFFRDEETRFRAFAVARQEGRVDALSSASDPQAELLNGSSRYSAEELRQRRVQEFGAAATQRLEQVEAAQAAWQQGLLAAQSEWERLKNAPELSDLQRQQAMARWLPEHFSEAEILRVKAVLQL